MKTLRRFLRLAAPFWFAKSQWREWLLLAAVVGCSLAIVRVSVLITDWNKTFYDALAAFDSAAMPALAGEYLLYITLVTALVAFGNWLRKILLFRWRSHLTQQFQQQWLGRSRHYRLQLQHGGGPDNPDQRIAEDIFLLSEKSIDLFKYFIMNAAKLGAFVVILWQLSSVQTFKIFGQNITVYGYLVWVALAYSAACTLLTHLIGCKLQPLNVERQHREADYRATLLRVRDHAEQIALYRGEAAEQRRLNRRFEAVRRNWRELIDRELHLETFSAAYLRLSMFIPIIATLPMYLAHTLTFGDMMKARSAFSNVQDGFGWFMDYYKRIIEWASVVERLDGFQVALNTLDDIPQKQPAHDSDGESGQTATLKADSLTLHTADGRTLLHGLSLAARAPEWLLLEGRSGIGKSTLLRTLAGLWPYYQGRFAIQGRSLFLPQRPYLPHDSLRNVLAYPYAAAPDNAAIAQVLKQTGLPRLAALDPDAEHEWHNILSGGEQQRLSLARALLHRPDVLFLDEATNQLDDTSAAELMHTLRQCLPDVLCIGISHQARIQELFERRVDLAGFMEGEMAGCEAEGTT
ncbi:ABC transporter ATP-binding protein [Eikenella sp. NML99-0057]|uniref:ABC transporter ATP-binding protein/permease n=1 Tax=Eikenella sp. NML99-0057 TaxID=1795834 RepID=UPI0007DF4F5E|nr:ABC transporter ATP-binding protein/permease [Eikenella sp. NML99-0057]OAM46091.1 ABC transporter ATP-binding protein [Eikenella sp. NML99-0057]